MTPDYDLLDETTVSKPTQAPGVGGFSREVTLHRAEEVVPLVDDLLATLSGLGYPSRDCKMVRLAVEEAVVNAVRHGNGGDPVKRVLIHYWARPDALLVEVEDEGHGFDPNLVPDPTLPENLDRPSGRGLLLMRHCMNWVRFLGSRVQMCKRRSV